MEGALNPPQQLEELPYRRAQLDRRSRHDSRQNICRHLRVPACVKGIPTVSGLLAAAIERTEPNETGTEQGNAGRFDHDRLSCQSEGFVEGPSSDNIGADAQPVGIEKGIASPRLQVREAGGKRGAWGDDRPC